VFRQLLISREPVSGGSCTWATGSLDSRLAHGRDRPDR
jgi:hypothetical protein